MSIDNTATSPRLTALQKELEAGNTAALDEFWQEVIEQGAPLIEETEDENYRLVTFLWRAEEVENVIVTGALAGLGYNVANRKMARLLDTNLWHKTYRARSDLRILYRLSPNDSLVPFDEAENWKERTATWQCDPLNPQTYLYPRNVEYPDESFDTEFSVLELPDAPAQPWIVPKDGVPAGQITSRRFHSEILGYDRRIWVYTPPGYTTSEEPYGLMVAFDGRAYIQIASVPTTMDNLLAEGLIPPLVTVFVNSPSQEARQELLCHEPFVEFLTEELLPWMREHYHITSDPKQTIVVGVSAGGVGATFAGFKRPDVFGNVLSQSATFWWKPDEEQEFEWLACQFAASEKKPLKFYLEVGLLEHWFDDPPSFLITNRHMRNVLQAKGYPVHYAEFNGGHDYICWQGSFADGLLALLGTEAT